MTNASLSMPSRRVEVWFSGTAAAAAGDGDLPHHSRHPTVHRAVLPGDRGRLRGGDRMVRRAVHRPAPRVRAATTSADSSVGRPAERLHVPPDRRVSAVHSGGCGLSGAPDPARSGPVESCVAVSSASSLPFPRRSSRRSSSTGSRSPCSSRCGSSSSSSAACRRRSTRPTPPCSATRPASIRGSTCSLRSTPGVCSATSFRHHHPRRRRRSGLSLE